MLFSHYYFLFEKSNVITLAKCEIQLRVSKRDQLYSYILFSHLSKGPDISFKPKMVFVLISSNGQHSIFIVGKSIYPQN